MKKNEKIRLSIGFVVFVLILLLFSQCVGSTKIFDKKSKLVETKLQSTVKDSFAIKTVNNPIKDSFKVFVPKISSDFNFEYKKAQPKNQEIITADQLYEIERGYSKKYSELLNKELNRILNSINTNKKSGENSYSVQWNDLTRTIDVNVVIGKTVNTETNNSEIKKADYKSELITFESVYKKIKVIPWWIWLIVSFIFIPTVLKLFSPHLAVIRKLFPQIK
jgi:hypothetical protein